MDSISSVLQSDLIL